MSRRTKHQGSRLPRRSPALLRSLDTRWDPKRTEQAIYRERLIEVLDVSSDAAGFIKTVINLDPSSSSEWASYNNLYDECRVMGIRVSLFSKQQYSVTVANSAVGVIFDNDDSSAITSIQGAAEYATVQWASAVFQHSVGMENESMAQQYAWARPTAGSHTAIQWLDCNLASATPGAVKLYSDNLAASTQYFRVIIERFLEFRGRN